MRITFTQTHFAYREQFEQGRDKIRGTNRESIAGILMADDGSEWCGTSGVAKLVITKKASGQNKC